MVQAGCCRCVVWMLVCYRAKSSNSWVKGVQSGTTRTCVRESIRALVRKRAAPGPFSPNCNANSLTDVVVVADPIARQSMAYGFNAAGYEVYQHIAGATALPRIIRKRPDAVVVEPAVSEMYGLALCREIRSCRRLSSLSSPVLRTATGPYVPKKTVLPYPPSRRHCRSRNHHPHCQARPNLITYSIKDTDLPAENSAKEGFSEAISILTRSDRHGHLVAKCNVRSVVEARSASQ